MIFECTAQAPLRQQHLFTPRTVTMRSFFAQQNHLGVPGFELRHRLVLSKLHEHMTLLP